MGRRRPRPRPPVLERADPPWDQVRAVELRESAFKGFIRPSPLIVLISIGCWAVVYFVVLPSCALFTPWHRRVILTLISGEKVVLRLLAGLSRSWKK